MVRRNEGGEDAILAPILEYTGGKICARLDHTQKTLVQEVSFAVSAGETLALIGETGSGKTLIAQSVMGVLPENLRKIGGAISFCGKTLPLGRNLRKILGREIAYIPQNGHEFLNPAKKIKHHLYDSLKKSGVPKPKRRPFACEKLTQAGLCESDQLLEQYPFQLSGGMAQRVTIALALCAQAKLLIADEPTNGLDSEGKMQFMDTLNHLFQNSAKLIITHDIAVAARCDRILVLCRGKMMETGVAAAVLQAPHHPYTRALIQALVENGMQETPTLRRQLGPCPFYCRCPVVSELCEDEPYCHVAGTEQWWCSRI